MKTTIELAREYKLIEGVGHSSGQLDKLERFRRAVEADFLSSCDLESYISNRERVKELEEANKLLEADLERVTEILHKINNWCEAYPISVFTEPDWNEVQSKLGSLLLTQVSGSNMRHVVTGIKKIIEGNGETE